jgi:hypothetical protein
MQQARNVPTRGGARVQGLRAGDPEGRHRIEYIPSLSSRSFARHLRNKAVDYRRLVGAWLEPRQALRNGRSISSFRPARVQQAPERAAEAEMAMSRGSAGPDGGGGNHHGNDEQDTLTGGALSARRLRTPCLRSDRCTSGRDRRGYRSGQKRRPARVIRADVARRRRLLRDTSAARWSLPDIRVTRHKLESDS